MICVDASEGSQAFAEGPSLQERFEAMRSRRCAAAARVKAAERAGANGWRSDVEKQALRERFLSQVRSYIGTPYSAARCGEGAPCYLDCCGLVRQALTDLKEDFGFEVGPWNQSYLFDTLPTAIAPEELRPGDLIFWQAEYDDAERKRQRHDLVHVEVYAGHGAGTIGSRYEGDIETIGVSMHASYRSFGGHGAHDHQVLFRSIEPWLEGKCISHCATCTWGESRGAAKSKIFAAEDAE